MDITSHTQGTVIEAATTLAGTFYDPDGIGQVERVELRVNGGRASRAHRRGSRPVESSAVKVEGRERGPTPVGEG